MEKKIVILGSSGSIGTQTLEVVDVSNKIRVVGLTVNTNIEILKIQIKKYSPLKVCIMDFDSFQKAKRDDFFSEVNLLFGMDGLIEIATMKEADIVVNALVGNIGLIPTIRAIESHKDIALANKETLVTGGSIIMELVKKYGVNIFPVDSEHSAIFQCLQGNEDNIIEKIYLTASGGPFRTKSLDELNEVTVEDALKHPNWSMGKKISIDSATMMNKGLEVIEAKWLFDIELEKIEVLIHPQSIIHSMVEFEDGAVIAQLGLPDMRVPINYALHYPNRPRLPFERINFTNYNFTFEKPDFKKLPCLDLAFRALKVGGTMPAILNAANEIAVEKFLNHEIKFVDIPIIIEKAMNAHFVKQINSVEDILEADEWARSFVKNINEVR